MKNQVLGKEVLEELRAREEMDRQDVEQAMREQQCDEDMLPDWIVKEVK